MNRVIMGTFLVACVGLVWGCGSGYEVVKSNSKYALSADAPDWAHAGGPCLEKWVPESGKYLCGVGRQPITSRRLMSTYVRAAEAEGCRQIALNLSRELKSRLRKYQNEYFEGVAANERQDYQGKLEDGLDEMVKMKLHGCGTVTTWISNQDEQMVYVKLDKEKALEAIRQNDKLGEAVKKVIDRRADELMDF